MLPDIQKGAQGVSQLQVHRENRQLRETESGGPRMERHAGERGDRPEAWDATRRTRGRNGKGERTSRSQTCSDTRTKPIGAKGKTFSVTYRKEACGRHWTAGHSITRWHLIQWTWCCRILEGKEGQASVWRRTSTCVSSTTRKTFAPRCFAIVIAQLTVKWSGP